MFLPNIMDVGLICFLLTVLTVDQVISDVDRPGWTGCQGEVDFAVAVDGSDSIPDEEFRTLRKSVANLVDRLNIGKNGARMAIVVYSSHIALETRLTDDIKYLKKKAKNMPHPRDGTSTDLAIKKMTSIFKNQGRLDQGIPTIAIIITDGISLEQEETAKQAKILKELGVEVIAVGVADFIDKDELNAIASGRRNMITVESFQDLQDNLEELVKKACTPATTPAPPVTRPPPIIIPPTRKPCHNCKIIHNIGYTPPLQCGKFTKYYFTTKGDIRSVVGNCEMGHHWDQNVLKCVQTHVVPCPKACRPEIHIPFDSSCRDMSGYNNYIRNHHVKVLGNGLAYFNGYAKLWIPRFRNIDYYTDIVVKMRYLDQPSNVPQGLISDGDCCNVFPTMMVVKSPKYLHYLAVCNRQTPATLHFPQRTGRWNEFTYVHDTIKLEGKVNGVYAEKWANSPIKNAFTGLQIGYARGFQNFKGYVDYVTIYLCRPDFIH